ncbi:hypothetical protein EC968_002351 [Mortierella alpina]|nr:hypothetical protein EC968_002351 [Mortierella alpina]
MEVDPFEARLEFLGLLGKLNASQHSIQKVGNFAMRNRNLYEDLYSCIIEELEQTSSINARMNIFYVLDSICHQSHKAGFPGYMELIQRNLPTIIDCVTPSGPKGNVNVAGTKKILETWRNKKLFPGSVIDTVEEPLLSRELGANAPMTTETGFTKDDILKRMDEDRERHKRIREEIWIRPSDEDPGAEFEQYWDEVADIEDVDYEDMESENDKYLPGYPWSLEFDRFLPSPAIFKSKASTLSQPSAESPSTPAISSQLSADGPVSPMDHDNAAGVKRLTSPEGTVSVAGSTVHAVAPLSKTAPQGPASSVTPSTSDFYHNGYHHPPLPPARRADHSHPHPSSSRSHYPHQTSQPSHSQHSYHAPHSHSYYEPAIPTGPAADTAAVPPSHHHHHQHHHPSASSVSTSGSSSVPRRGSPPPTSSSSSYHPYGHSRPYYHERTSSGSSAHSGYANGRAADHAP